MPFLPERPRAVDRTYHEVVPEDEALLLDAQELIGRGQWAEARQAFSALVKREPVPQALFGLGVAEWWLGRIDLSLRLWERAFAGYRRAGDQVSAVVTAVYLCLSYRMSLGDDLVAQGWKERAATLVATHDLHMMAGWVDLCSAFLANDGGLPSEAEKHARAARALGTEYGDTDLELCAAGELGAALVSQGRFAEGSALLDEAMAAALAGEASELDTVVLVTCRTLTCCSLAWDVRRATQWIRAGDDFQRQYGSPHLFTTCRVSLAALHFASGKWEDAEAELRRALDAGDSTDPELVARSVAQLAEIRLAQGRVEEAARLLVGFEDNPPAAFVLARLHLSRGEVTAARPLLQRRLRRLESSCLEAVRHAELLIEVALTAGRMDEARALAHAVLAEGPDADPFVAVAERATGRMLAACGDQGATDHLEAALAAFTRLGMPYESARTRLLLAQHLADREPVAATAEARRAHDVFRELGAALADDAAALLRELGVRPAPGRSSEDGLLTRRESEVLALLGEGLSNKLIAERLFISRKTVEHHVARILTKLDLPGRGAAAAYAVRHESAGK